MDINLTLEKFKNREIGKDRQYEIDQQRQILESKQNRQQFWKLMGKVLVPATIDDYKKWLMEYLEKGGILTHYYDYPMARVLDRWYIATTSFRIPVPLHGSDSISIIVPNGIYCSGGVPGHIGLYFLGQSKEMMVGGIVAVYSDISFGE